MANNGLILYMERGLGNVELPGTEYQMIKEEFDKVCDEQEKIDTSGFGEVYECINEHLLEGKSHPTLYPYTDDKGVLLKALEMTGHGKDEAFCGRFMNHYRLFVKGKELQAKGIAILAEHTPQIEMQIAGWRFIPITIAVPEDLCKYVSDKMIKDAQEGKGLYADLLQIPQEDEALDEFLGVEPYGLKCSFVPFLDELRQFGIVDGDNPFFSKELSRGLFATLKEAASYIKENTDRPQATKNKIAALVKKFGDLPMWGLFFQILTLQGLCRLLESANIGEGDEGYDEVCSLYQWLINQLAMKEIEFCYKPHGVSELLRPFCTYLLSTEVGQSVQRKLFETSPQSKQIVQESALQASETDKIPDIESSYDKSYDDIFDKRVNIPAVKEALEKLTFKKDGRVEWFVVYKVFLHLKWLKEGCVRKSFLQWVNLQFHCGWHKEHHFTFRDVHKTLREKDISCWHTIDYSDYTKGEKYYNFAVLLRNTFELVIINGKESKEPVVDFSIGENRDKTSFMSKPSQLINWGK